MPPATRGPDRGNARVGRAFVEAEYGGGAGFGGVGTSAGAGTLSGAGTLIVPARSVVPPGKPGPTR